MTAQTPLIRCEGLTRRFGRKRVIRDLSLTVAGGEVVALLGANGSGKTTLLQIIAGLDKPEKGEVWLGPVRLSTASHEIRRYVGFVAHAPLLYDQLTGAENLRFFGRMYDLNGIENRIEQLLRSMRLWLQRDDPVGAYSRGMLQRLAIARAILHDPPVLIFDEPDSGLDRESLGQLEALIRTLRRKKRAVLITTHDWERAFAWADRVCELRDGRLHPLERSECTALRED